jgi:general secretion pathway protein A
MYNAYFGLDTDPFRVNPDPQFLYLSDSHREALATLVYAVSEHKGFIVQTGEVGTGKTTVLNAMLGRLDARVKSAYLFNTALSVEDFFVYLFNELEIEHVEPFNKSRALHRLNEYLIERLGRGLQTLLIVDEAQNLSTELLEEIRMLSNLETPRSKLLQIILVGQPELAEKLARPELRQLRQRVELRHTIRPLTADEVAEYVRERLLIAGHETGKLFSSSALRAVHRYSEGIPRIINVLCDNALIVGFARQAVRISAQMVREAAGELDLAPGRDRAAAPRAPVAPASSNRASRRAGRPGFMRKLWSWRPAEPELGV